MVKEQLLNPTLEDNELLRFINFAMEYLEEENFPDYSSVYSRRDFTQKQLLILLLLKCWMNFTYEKFIMHLYTSDRIIKALGLKKIPHFTTLQKFSKRIDNRWLKKILRDFRRFCSKKNFLLGMDGTGFSLNTKPYQSVR